MISAFRIRVARQGFSYLAPAALVLLALTGCAGHVVPPVGQTVSLHMQGKVHGGQQPVVGAAIQLFDITSGGPGMGAAPLISSSVLSDVNGSFSITGDYTCPNASDQVYLAATGGDPGSGTNADLVMMTALGNCGDLTSSTFIFVNEVTTVATVWAYAADYDPAETGGAGANIDYPLLGTEYANFLTLVDPATGFALSANPTVQLQVNALANSLSTCVNSATNTSGDSIACDGLINDADGGQPFFFGANDSATIVWTVVAAPFYFQSPISPTAVFTDAPASGPFQPTLTVAPASWNLGFDPFD